MLIKIVLKYVIVQKLWRNLKLGQPNNSFLVMKFNPNTVSYFPIFTAQKCVWISDIWVRPNYRRQKHPKVEAVRSILLFITSFVPVFDGMMHGTTVTSLSSGNSRDVIGLSTSSCEDVVTSNSSAASAVANSQMADSAAVESLSDVFRCFICMERLRFDICIITIIQ